MSASNGQGRSVTGRLAHWTRSVPPAAPCLVLCAGLLAGCAGGLIGAIPPVGKPYQASTVTIYRDLRLPGIIGPIILRIDGRRTYRLWVNQQFSFLLDPGEYLFDWTIGLNECRRVAVIEPRRIYRFRLAPNCVRFQEPAWGDRRDP